MFTNKTDLLIGLAAGIVAGAVGYKMFQDHKGNFPKTQLR